MTNADKQVPSRKSWETSIQALKFAAEDELILSHENACRLIKRCVDSLDYALQGDDKATDIIHINAFLDGIALFLRSNNHEIVEADYRQLLNRLTGIYNYGFASTSSLEFAATASSYADVIGAISKTYPDYDYGKAISQLLHFMNQLYSNRQDGWVPILQHLLAMPDSIQRMYILKRDHLKGIQDWVDEGASHLFQLRDEQEKIYTSQLNELDASDQEIARKHGLLDIIRNGKIVPLSYADELADIKLLESKRTQLATELTDQRRLVDLLDENILEFNNKFYETRRAFLLSLVKGGLSEGLK